MYFFEVLTDRRTVHFRGRNLDSNSVKKLKRGERLFSEGETLESLYLIKSGKVSLFLERSGKKIEIEQLGGSTVLGDENLFLNHRQSMCAEAVTEVQYLEIPIKSFHQILDKSIPLIKMMFKSTVEQVKTLRSQVKSKKLESDVLPCPERLVPKVFGGLVLVAKHTAKEEDGVVVLDWGQLKLYMSRFFLESPQRIQNCLQILSKIKLADLTYEKNEDDIEELTTIKIHDIHRVEAFAEFFQFHLYKGGKSEILYVDKLAYQCAKVLADLTEGIEPDFRGATNINFDKAVNEAKEKHKFDFKSLHLDLLERKGLFVSRKSKDKGGVDLSFDRNELVETLQHWQILSEIDMWNEKGFIDMSSSIENSFVKIESTGGDSCPSCENENSPGANFCQHCGFKLAA